MVTKSSERFGMAQGQHAEDELRALVSGNARYTSDFSFSDQAHAVFVRSPFAHGVIRKLTTDTARRMPGVLAVFTGTDIQRAGLGDLRCVLSLTHPDGSPMAQTPHPLLATDRIRHVGELVAMVVAGTRAQADDAAQAIELDVDMQPAVSDVELALRPDAPALWPEVRENTGLRWCTGDAAAVARRFERAQHVARVRLVNTRVVGNPMEPRAALAWLDENSGRYTLITPSQGVNPLKRELAGMLGLAPERLRVITPQVGGGFGIKTPPYPEQALVLWAAARLGRPVKWEGGRTDSFLGDNHGRDSVIDGELALAGDGRFLALRATVHANMGAYFSSNGAIVPTVLLASGLTSVYRTEAISLDVRCVFTNTVPTGPYRGAGRPEAAYLVERLVEEAARELAVDRVELRRQNLIPARTMPYRTPLGQTYDSGEFEAVLDAALRLSDWQGFEAREAHSRARGRWRGIGLACFLETAGGVLRESAAVHFTADDLVEVRTAAQSNGQGHTDSLARTVAEQLELPVERVRVIQGDSDVTPEGYVSVASRTMMMAGSACAAASVSAIEKGRQLAAHVLETATADLEYAAGRYRVAGTDREIGLFELARWTRTAQALPDDVPATLDATENFTSPEQTFPNGCHVCEVEIDAQTGVVRVADYTAVDDCGRAMAPRIVQGQLHGGIAQGLGQVLGEHAVYDGEGQLLAGSFMDYLLPRADNLPPLRTALHPVPCRTNPLGVKGAGEAGTVGAIPAAMNAIIDALHRARGITRFDMPATPHRVWQRLREATDEI